VETGALALCRDAGPRVHHRPTTAADKAEAPILNILMLRGDNMPK
jgi:hypothetical protein